MRRFSGAAPDASIGRIRRRSPLARYVCLGSLLLAPLGSSAAHNELMALVMLRLGSDGLDRAAENSPEDTPP